MDSSKIAPVDKIKECLRNKQNFVLQGGAGSGKTETLKQVLEFISKEFPEKRIACITHTNLAVDEIVSRVGNDRYTICTIHSFLNDFIKDYKKNIHRVIFEIFKLDKVARKDLAYYEDDEQNQKKTEYDNFKRQYEKYAKELFTLTEESIEKVPGKREYDNNPEQYNSELNEKIDSLNNEIIEIIQAQDYNQIGYNDTRFDSLKDLTYGHDSLLVIASLLFDKYQLLGRILEDKFDYIFIDEYQDTSENIINIFLNKIQDNKKTTVGFFGDSMQGIYDDRVGDIDDFISEGKLIKIEKEDNYRCSKQVIDFINNHRNDNLKQEIAFKTINGAHESLGDRQGTVKLYYSIYNDKKPHSMSPNVEKENYSSVLLNLLRQVEKVNPGYKKLMLTNKSISAEVGFKNLYNIFNARYSDVKEEIEKDLIRLQLIDLVELCMAYKQKNYNFIITELKKSGFILKSIHDKLKIKKQFDEIISSDLSAIGALDFAFKNNLLKQSESYLGFISRKDQFLKDIAIDIEFQSFKNLYRDGKNTFKRMKESKPDLTNEYFDEQSKLLLKETFYLDLFSTKVQFQEIIKYYQYLNEETDYITMHKTKGSGIENVLVVLDEYFWSKYDFKTLFYSDEADRVKKNKTQKLFYVACSRAIKNLICVRLISSEEEKQIKGFFDNYELINISKL